MKVSSATRFSSLDEAHQRGTQGAVQAHGERARVAHAVPEGGDGLAGRDAAEVPVTVPLMMRAGARRSCKELVNREQRVFGVQVSKMVSTSSTSAPPSDQRFGLLLVVRRAQLLKVDVAGARVVHIGADAGRLGRGAGGPATKRGSGRACELVTGAARANWSPSFSSSPAPGGHG